MSGYSRCTEVTPLCPVEATTYGYYPNFGGNLFFCIVFGILLVFQLGFGTHYRTWTWMFGLGIGCLFEFVGYIGRLLMNDNPWSSQAFKIQLVLLILGPSLISGGIDLTLKHIVIVFGRDLSRLPPALYTWLFIGLDIASIVIQAIGGGIAAAATGGNNSNQGLLDVGNNMLLAGIVVQVAQLVLFGLVSADYLRKLWVHRKGREMSPLAHQCLQSWKFKGFMVGLTIAYLTILTRCIYRIPEMSGGWGSDLQRDEAAFLVLDGAMVCTAGILLTVFHPGFCFSQLSNSWRRKNGNGGSTSTSEETPPNEKDRESGQSSPQPSSPPRSSPPSLE